MESEEEWRGLEVPLSKYEVSNWGGVRNKKTRRKLTPVLIPEQYYVVTLQTDSKESKTLKVHRLIAEAFHPNSSGHPVVDHIDGDPKNNRWNNLRWVTYAINAQNSAGSKKRYRNGTPPDILPDLNTEEWIKLEFIDAEVSSLGRIKFTTVIERSTFTRKENRITWGSRRKNGYQTLIIEGKMYLVHRLIMCGFHNKPYEHEYDVDHKNNIRHDNRLENLRWATRRENIISTVGKKVIKIDSKTGNILGKYDSLTSAAQENGTRSNAISLVCQGKQQTAGGFKWAYCGHNKTTKSHINIPVKQMSLNGEVINIFESYNKAGLQVGTVGHRIKEACNGVRKTVKGYRWEHMTE